MGRGFLTYTTAVILQAVANGYLYGFDIIDVTGVPSGTVYPALRRLVETGHLTSRWEEPAVAQAEPRPARKYYELTAEGRVVLAEAVKKFRLLDRTSTGAVGEPNPSDA